MSDKVQLIDPNIGLGEEPQAVAERLNHRLADGTRLFTLLLNPGQQHDSTVAQQLMRLQGFRRSIQG